MTVFRARNASSSTVPAPTQAIWELVTDPTTLAELTPLVSSIEAAGSTWTWSLDGITALGVTVDAVFTVRMEFIDGRRIVFSHEPPAGGRELAGLAGSYELTPDGDGQTDLAIDLTLSVDLPLPALSRKAVEGVLRTTMRTTGRRFAANLYDRLGLDPSTVDISEHRLP